ncbi:MAG TPA: tetratricopeptide repeat protein [Polyangia bacterium]|jgi:tetratricopeptide (TPR) repeat protein|nr:tetratricopeptide repeat protein [Polyangia bacterium]
MRPSKLTRAALALVLVSLMRSAHADEIDDYTRKLIDLDQRVHVMTLEFKDAPPPPPDIADRRVVDAQVLFGLKNFQEAATILLDVIEKWPNSRAYDDALFLLGEALFQGHDPYSSRRYFELFLQRSTGSKREQEALQRLIEIAFRTGDYEHVDDYLAKLENIPPERLEPATPYVRAKLFYFRGKDDDALAQFSTIQPGNPYYFQARYFMATILVKKGDLAGAAAGFEGLLKLQAPDEGTKEIQDLCRLAIGRILYERSQFTAAIEAYQTIPRQSKYFSEALDEQAWTYIKAKEWQKAWRSIDLLLLNNPDLPDAPDKRLLLGNLQLRIGNFYFAEAAFTKVRDEFDPVQRQLQAVLVRSQADPAYFDNLVGKSLEKFDISVFVPPTAAKWVRAEPDVERMINLATDVGELQRDLQESEKLVARIQRAMQSNGRSGIFPDLAAARTRSLEIENQLIEIRQKFVGRVRAILNPILSADERKTLDHIAVERDALERQLKNLPTTQDAIKLRSDDVKAGYKELDGRASELNVEIQSLEAQLVAIEQYYRTSRTEQKIRPEDIQQPLKDLRGTVESLRAMHDKIREEIADASREDTVAGGSGQIEHDAGVRLTELLRQEQEVQARAKHRLGAGDQQTVDRVNGVLSRTEAVGKQIDEYNQRVDKQVDLRLETVKTYLATEKEELARASTKLGAVVNESQNLGGGLAHAMFSRVADRFYDLVVRADYGIIDVSWGLKDQKTSAVTKLTNLKNLELRALDEDFKKVMEDDK